MAITVSQALQTLTELKEHQEQINLALSLLNERPELPAAQAILHAGQIDLDTQIKGLEDRLNRSVLAE